MSHPSVTVMPVPATAHDRKRLVAQLREDGNPNPPAVYERLLEMGVVNYRSGRPYSLSTIRNDFRSMTGQGYSAVGEIVGRTVTGDPLWKMRLNKSVDATQGDYEFWDKLRRGKAEGFKFGGLFVMPLTQIIASFVFGDGIKVKLVEDVVEADAERVEYTNGLLSRFTANHHNLLLNMGVDLYGLGDQYLAVNPDSSVTAVAPELVTKQWAPLDYRTTTSITVTTQLEDYTVTDVYTPSTRTVTIQKPGTDPSRKIVQTFDNLIGRLPIVHFPNDRGTNEIYGRPVVEALYRPLSRYDDLLEKALDGTELMGNPMPVFQGMENIDDTIDANATQDDEEYTDPDGNEEDRKLIKWDTRAVLWVGKGGEFKFASPVVGFTDDIRAMLKSIFLLILDYTRVPEAVWGGAIESSKASAEVQMPPFHQYLQGRRVALAGQGADPDLGVEASGGLYEFFDVWLRTRALTDPRVVVGPVEIVWQELSQENKDLLLSWAQWLRGIGALTDETSLTLFGKVVDPAKELVKARQEAKERQQKELDLQDEYNARLQAAQAEADREATDERESQEAAAD